MKNRITELFAKKKNNILNIYFTAGFPALNDTVRIAQLLEKSGADIIEIGIPFSDPVADGPTIQASNKVALDNGMTLATLLDQVKEIRQHVSLPIILMGYINPVMQYGIEKFAKDASAIGVDGVIIPDLPLHEFEEQYKDLFESVNLCNTFLISPTTSEERIRKIDAVTEGFIYAVSASSITGAKGDFSPEQVAYFERLQAMKLKNPFLIGFGISNQETFNRAASYSTGAIVGSAFINLLKDASDLPTDIERFVKSLRK
ncbi:tryptophan synthase subunit alpha [Ohtaekwangia sp.]|uniref:tryptophan synthase subunit alpha n=1 Tax=Ohtaekwangia sp. TaxID=2066019 RepID=UPI002F95813F